MVSSHLGEGIVVSICFLYFGCAFFMSEFSRSTEISFGISSALTFSAFRTVKGKFSAAAIESPYA